MTSREIKTTSTEAFRKFEEAGWGRVGEAYNEFFAPITSRVIDPLLDSAGVASGVGVLDVGSGPGWVAERCLERGASVVGADISDAMVALAKRLHPRIEFRKAPAEGLPFDDSSFDAVVGSFLIPHLADPGGAASEMARVLGPGGKLGLTNWAVPGDNRLLGVFYDAIREAGAATPASVPPGPPMFLLSEDAGLRKLLEGSGLAKVTVVTLSFVQVIDTSEALWKGMLSSGVRTPAMISGQTADVQERIRRSFDVLANRYLGDDGRLHIPVAVKLASAEKPRP